MVMFVTTTALAGELASEIKLRELESDFYLNQESYGRAL